MHLKFSKRSRTLSKLCPFDNILLKVTYASLTLIVTILYSHPSFAGEIPVKISWWQPEGRTQGYRIEVSDEPKFGTTVLKADAPTNSYTWSAPKEGVYHWRVTPLDRIEKDSSKKGAQMVESSSFASGSFVALDPAVAGSDPMVPLRWSPSKDASAFHLVVTPVGGVDRTVVSLKNEMSISREATPISIRVIAHSARNNAKVSRDVANRFDPELNILRTMPTEEPIVAVVPAAPPELLVGDQTPPPKTLEALPPAPGKIELRDVTTVMEDFPEERISEWLLGVYSGTENLYASKGNIVRNSKGSITGGFAALRVMPVVGLHLSGQIEGHGRSAQWKDDFGSSIGSQPISPALGQVGVGFDTFFKNPNRRHQFVLEVRGAVGQTPTIPSDNALLVNDEQLKLRMATSQLVGGGAWYRWTVKRWGVGLRASYLVQPFDRSHKNDATLEEWGGFVAMDPIQFVTIQLGGWSRYTRVAQCAESADLCAVEGVSQARMSQKAVYLALGYVMY